MLALIESPDADMDALASLGKVGLHFLADEEILEIRVLVQQVESAVDRVMIGEGDVAHSSFFGDAVDVLRRVVAVSGIGAPEILEHRKAAVTVQIRPLQRGIGSGV